MPSAAAVAMAAAEERYDPELTKHGGQFEQKFAIGQVTIRLPLDLRPLPMLALSLSFVPWILPLFILADATFTLRRCSVISTFMVLVCALLTEVILKPWLKQPRPAPSACRDSEGRLLDGMPSGHVMNSQTLATWYLLQALWVLDKPRAHWTAALLVSAMPAVPWARWYNGDHTLNQVLVTMVLASVLSLFAFAAWECTAPESWRMDIFDDRISAPKIWQAMPTSPLVAAVAANAGPVALAGAAGNSSGTVAGFLARR